MTTSVDDCDCDLDAATALRTLVLKAVRTQFIAQCEYAAKILEGRCSDTRFWRTVDPSGTLPDPKHLPQKTCVTVCVKFS